MQYRRIGRLDRMSALQQFDGFYRPPLTHEHYAKHVQRIKVGRRYREPLAIQAFCHVELIVPLRLEGPIEHYVGVNQWVGCTAVTCVV